MAIPAVARDEVGEDAWASGAVDRGVDTAADDEGSIRGVDDGVRRDPRQVALGDLQDLPTADIDP